MRCYIQPVDDQQHDTAPAVAYLEERSSSPDLVATLEPEHTTLSMPATVSAGQTQTLRIPVGPPA